MTNKAVEAAAIAVYKCVTEHADGPPFEDIEIAVNAARPIIREETLSEIRAHLARVSEFDGSGFTVLDHPTMDRTGWWSELGRLVGGMWEWEGDNDGR